MQLSADTRVGANVVVGYSATELRLRDRTLRSSAILTARRIEDWPVTSLAQLSREALDRVLALGPEVILLSTGERQRFPDLELYAYVQSRGVGFEVMDVGAACRTYNVLVGEDRPVALALVMEPG